MLVAEQVGEGDRTLLTEANGRKSVDDLVEYRKVKNATSIDGLPALASPGGGPERLRGGSGEA